MRHHYLLIFFNERQVLWCNYRLYDMKTRTVAIIKSGKPLCKVLLHRMKKVSFDVLTKTFNILSKIKVILDIYGTKELTICTVEYHTTFFEFILEGWACIKCFLCFLVCLLFLHPSSVESRWKSRRTKVFHFANEFLVYMFVSLYSIWFSNFFFNF